MIRPAASPGPSTVGAALRQARRSRGWSQDVLARRVAGARRAGGESVDPVSVKTQLSRWETGGLAPYADIAYIASEHAEGLLVLGEPEDAADTLAAHVLQWAPGQERDHAVAQARWLQALAASGDCQTALDHCDDVLLAYERAPSVRSRSALHAVMRMRPVGDQLHHTALRRRIAATIEGTRSRMTPILPAYVTTDPEVVDARLAVLPVGSFEQHGPHLPLVTDTLIAVAIANGISDRYGALQLPPVTFSCSHEHADFAGTVSVSATTLAAIVTDIAQSLDRQGIRRLLVVNGHGGNYVLGNLVQQAMLLQGGVRLGLFPAREDWNEARQAAGMTSDSHEDMHAGELEVSILLAAFPDAVREGWEHDDHTADDRRHLSVLGMSAYAKTGVVGRPSLASAENGQAALDHLVGAAQHILKILDETSNKR